VATSNRNAPPVHRALQAARKAAGFETAAAAAAHFGWSVGRYRSHESGARTMRDDDIREYAQSFKVTMTSLHTPEWEIIDRQLEKARETADKPRMAVARRLRCARILRGLSSAIEASKAFGIGTPAYLKHENGENGINAKLIEFYAARLSIVPEWLSSGLPPSGLGREVDSRIHRVLTHPEAFAGVAAPASGYGHHSSDQAVLDGGRPVGTVPVPEYRWSHLVERGDLSSAAPSGVIQFPKASDQPDRSDGVFSVLLDVPNRYAPRFTRLFLTRMLPGPYGDAQYLTASVGFPEVVRLKTSEALKARNLFGRLVGQLAGPS
jgi:hypothetical protein